MREVSWIIVSIETGKPVMETFDFELCQFVNIAKYRVIPAYQWLVSLNQ